MFSYCFHRHTHMHTKLCSFVQGFCCFIQPPTPFVSSVFYSLLCGVTLSFAATHPLCLSFALKVKPFQGPLVLKYQCLSCQMHWGREEWLVYCRPQEKGDTYTHSHLSELAHGHACCWQMDAFAEAQGCILPKTCCQDVFAHTLSVTCVSKKTQIFTDTENCFCLNAFMQLNKLIKS